MLTPATTAYASSASLTSLQTLAQSLMESDARAKKNTPAVASGAPTGTDTVTLSPAAQAILSAKSDATTGYYAQFFPTRDGAPATALAAVVINPGTESFSSGKTLSEAAAAARTSMDAKYADMADGGKPFDYNSFEGKDWYSLMGDLDRRALYAVSSNEGGQFTEQEQGIAQSIMSQQQGLAMGLYNGPTRLQGSFSDKFANDNAARFKSNVIWLDNVSNDEKSSITWAVNRASAQTAYEWTMEDRGQTPDNLDSENPLVKLIKAAMSTMKDNIDRAYSSGRITNIDELKDQAWFTGFEDQLAPAIQATKDMYAAQDSGTGPA